MHANNLCEYVLLDLTTGQTQLSKAGKLGTSKKTQLLSEAQTQITSTSLETGELVRNTHVHLHLHSRALHYTHTHTPYTLCMYICMLCCNVLISAS